MIQELISNCCGAGVDGELTNSPFSQDEGRCNDCKEMCSFIRVLEVEQIKSEYPLGTTDGISYTIVPRA
jgi:hypothetical protein